MAVVAVVGRRSLEHSVVLQVIYCREITEVAVTAAERELCTVLVAVVAENLVPPVYIRMGIIGLCRALVNGIESVKVFICVAGGEAVQLAGLVHVVCIGICI